MILFTTVLFSPTHSRTCSLVTSSDHFIFSILLFSELYLNISMCCVLLMLCCYMFQNYNKNAQVKGRDGSTLARDIANDIKNMTDLKISAVKVSYQCKRLLNINYGYMHQANLIFGYTMYCLFQNGFTGYQPR